MWASLNVCALCLLFECVFRSQLVRQQPSWQLVRTVAVFLFLFISQTTGISQIKIRLLLATLKMNKRASSFFSLMVVRGNLTGLLSFLHLLSMFRPGYRHHSFTIIIIIWVNRTEKKNKKRWCFCCRHFTSSGHWSIDYWTYPLCLKVLLLKKLYPNFKKYCLFFCLVTLEVPINWCPLWLGPVLWRNTFVCHYSRYDVLLCRVFGLKFILLFAFDWFESTCSRLSPIFCTHLPVTNWSPCVSSVSAQSLMD